MGVGGAGVVQWCRSNYCDRVYITCIFNTSCWYKNQSGNAGSSKTTTASINPDSVLCVALEVGQGGTGHCCIAHCVHHQRASLRLVVNSNKVNTQGHIAK